MARTGHIFGPISAESTRLCLRMLLVLVACLSSNAALAHRSGPVGLAAGLSIPTLGHGQMAVVANHYAEILDLADRQVFTDERFRRFRNYISLQYAACLWGMVPASLTDEESPFNECSHGYLSGAQALLLHMKTMPGMRDQANALAERISLEMLAQNAAMVVCRYSDEPFNTADVVSPHWSEVPFHAPSLLALLAAAGIIGGALAAALAYLSGPRPGDGALAGSA